jgi:hypothetical protein
MFPVSLIPIAALRHPHLERVETLSRLERLDWFDVEDRLAFARESGQILLLDGRHTTQPQSFVTRLLADVESLARRAHLLHRARHTTHPASR